MLRAKALKGRTKIWDFGGGVERRLNGYRRLSLSATEVGLDYTLGGQLVTVYVTDRNPTIR